MAAARPKPHVDSPLPQSTERAFDLLLEAYVYAEEANRDVWDFAVEIGDLRRADVSRSVLRWLVCQGYVEHGKETTAAAAGTRSFRPGTNLKFSRRTAFVLTEAGVKIARQATHGAVRHTAETTPGIRLAEGGSHSGLPSAAGEPLCIKRNGVPKWDRDRHELTIDGQLVKVFKLPSPMQEAILMAFEEEAWPPRIDDPLPVHPGLLPKRRLHDTIKGLNRNQKCSRIRFMGDGTGEGVRWELIPREDVAESPRGGAH